jgi:uncharacterized OB-fold protein
MSVLDTIREMLVPDTESGVWYECAECGAEFDTAREACPECGSTDLTETEGFDMRPDA